MKQVSIYYICAYFLAIAGQAQPAELFSRSWKVESW